jgi:copper chaperone CopZ
MVDYSKWDKLDASDDDGDPEPEDLPPAPEPAQQPRRRAAAAAASSSSGSGSRGKGKTSSKKKTKPKAAEEKSAYVPSFAGEAGRFMLLRVQGRWSPVLMPEDNARIKYALEHVDGVEKAVIDPATKSVTVWGPRGLFAKNPPPEVLMKAVENAGMPGYVEEVEVTMLNKDAEEAAAKASADAGGPNAEIIDSFLQLSAFWGWLFVGAVVVARAAGLQQPCSWCMEIAQHPSVALPAGSDSLCDVVCAGGSREIVWTRWNVVSVVVLTLEAAGENTIEKHNFS